MCTWRCLNITWAPSEWFRDQLLAFWTISMIFYSPGPQKYLKFHCLQKVLRHAAKKCEKMRKVKKSDFRQGALQKPPRVILALLKYYMSASFGISMENMEIMKIHDFLTFWQSWPRHVHFIYKTNTKSIVFRGAEGEKVKIHENSLFALRADPL